MFDDVNRSVEDKEKQPLLSINNLYVEYRASGSVARAVNGVDLTIHRGEALGLVGESGAGKTTLALSILRLLPDHVGRITKGEIFFQGESLLKKREKEMDRIRGKEIGMVFANPLTSLNPVFTVGHQVAMVFQKHMRLSEKEAWEKAKELFDLVGIPEYRMNDYPHQFSGGMRQRVGIAAALACSPQLLLADEPTTALDVTIQAQILELIRKLQSQYDMSLLMITHNLGIIAELCQRVAIMYAGELVEYGTVREVFENPLHPYTEGLLGAIPKLNEEKESLESIPGLVANATALPAGCKFHERCKHCLEKCRTQSPPAYDAGNGHFVKCFRMEEQSNGKS